MVSYKLRTLGDRRHRVDMFIGGDFIGYIDYSQITFDELFVNHVEILERYRGRGYGSQLINYLLLYYPHMKGAWRDLKARNFWVKMGADFERGRSFKIEK